MSGPHDLFARYTFGHPERAAAEPRAVLPAHVVSEVDWSSLRREPGSVVRGPSIWWWSSATCCGWRRMRPFMRRQSRYYIRCWTARQRILTCTDVATLDRWFARSLNATTLADVLDDLAQ